MATIRQRGPEQWQALIRRQGWPYLSRTFRTRKDAVQWARATEAAMDSGQFVDRSPSLRTTLKDCIDRYLVEVTDKRPGEESRVAERARLERFLREEKELCAHAVAHLRPDDFEAYRDRRATQTVSRGQQGGRGQPKQEAPPLGRLRMDGKPRKNAAKPKKPKPPTLIQPGTIRRELTLLKRVIDHSKRRLGLHINPVNSEDVKRPTANDERDIRLETAEIEKLLKACYAAANEYLGPVVEVAFETGARRGSLIKLRYPDVDLSGASATLRGVKNSRDPTKSIDITIGLTPRAVEIIKGLRRIDGDNRVFPITRDALKSAFDRAREKAGLEHFNFHDTRHERASSLIEAGWGDIEVMAQTGHRDPKSLKRYANLRKKYLADKLAALPSRKLTKMQTKK